MTKKAVKTLSSLIMSFAILFCSVSLYADINFTSSSDEKERTAFSSNRAKSRETPDSLFNSFSVNTPRDVTEIIYPDSYGDAHLDSEGNLVLLEVDSTTAAPLTPENGDDEVNVVKAIYYYNELKNEMDYLQTLIGNDYTDPIIFNISAYGIDPMLNRIVVSMVDNSEEQIALFKSNILDSPLIHFNEEPVPHSFVRPNIEKSVIIEEPSSSVNPEEAVPEAISAVTINPLAE